MSHTCQVKVTELSVTVVVTGSSQSMKMEERGGGSVVHFSSCVDVGAGEN